MHNQIEFKKVTKVFSDDIYAIEDATFNIKKGEFVFLIGKSGSGKSTLLKLLSGQVQPTAGEINVFEQDIVAMHNRDKPYFRRKIGIMQSSFDLLPKRTVKQNLEIVLLAIGIPRKFIKERVKRALLIVGIQSKLDFYPHELSAGEKARVLLARAIVTGPEILVIDEPTANLSSEAAWDIMKLLENINNTGITMIVTSHDSELVTILRKRVITIVSGVIVADDRKGYYDYKKMDIYEEQRVANERKSNKRLRN